MKLITKKRLTQMGSEYFVLAFYLTGNERSGYGIKIVELYGDRVLTACHVDHISPSRTEILELINLYAEAELCPVHLTDIVVDHYTQKGLCCAAQSRYSTA